MENNSFYLSIVGFLRFEISNFYTASLATKKS